MYTAENHRKAVLSPSDPQKSERPAKVVRNRSAAQEHITIEAVSTGNVTRSDGLDEDLATVRQAADVEDLSDGRPLYCSYVDHFNRTSDENLIATEQRQTSLPVTGNRASFSFSTRMTPRMCESFGGLIERQFSTSARSRCLDDFTGNEISSVSYQSCDPRGTFAPNAFVASASTSALHSGATQKDDSSLGGRSWSFFSILAATAVQSAPTFRNPNKAVLTLNSKTSEILTANDMACNLFAMDHSQLVGKRLKDMVVTKMEKLDGQPSVLFFTDVGVDGSLIKSSGKVIKIKDAEGVSIPVAICIQTLPFVHSEENLQNGHVSNLDAPCTKKLSISMSAADVKVKCLAVLEPVERLKADCTVDEKGRIFRCDDNFALLFGQSNNDDMLGMNVIDFLPAVNLHEDKDKFIQHVTAKVDHTSIPLEVKTKVFRSGDQLLKIDVKLYIYSTISGVITVLPDGTIHSCNDHFTALMFGYHQSDLVGQSILKIIPRIFEELKEVASTPEETFSVPPLFERDCGESAASVMFRNTSEGSHLSRSTIEMHNPLSTSVSEEKDESLTTSPVGFFSGPTARLPRSARLTSTPTRRSSTRLTFCSKSPSFITEGSFWGHGRHKDGSSIAIGYQIREVSLADGGSLFCIWIVRDPEADPMELRYNFSFTYSSIKNCTTNVDGTLPIINDLTRSKLDNKGRLRSFNHPCSPAPKRLSIPTDEYTKGDFDLKYDTLQQIGKGAFGCVRLAARKEDGLLVICKFIAKSKVLAGSWVVDHKLGRVPIEISLLSKLKHKNIVKLMDVFHNDFFFQMVMEKHGSGMDLFEFIDREPRLDEPLASYIFRQVVWAISHLHSLGIVHRDIKDENVIINEKFECKLIDFGSAAYMEPGVQFSTFCGTMEYCSPEVLLGHKYSGPELEIWSLGVLLYTLIYGENPFADVRKAIEGQFQPPWDVSEGLYNLVSWMLCPLPHHRISIQQVEKHWWTEQPVDIAKYKFKDVIPVLADYEIHPPTYLHELNLLKP